MRRLLFILTIAALSLISESIYSWDSTAAKYFPLQVGNTWVYTGVASGYIYYGRFYYAVKISGVVDTLNKKYYSVQHRLVMISGSASCGIWNFSNLIRIDSATMNLYKQMDFCNSNEVLLDSLRSNIYDSATICTNNPNNKSICIDTSMFNIFNNNYPSKRFSSFLGPSFGAIYAKGIGIVSYGYGYSMNQCHDSLRGCVINGVLYGDTSTFVGINQINSEVPAQFSLYQNYPNPFNPATNIKFDVSESGFIRLVIFDVLGKEVKTLVNEQLSPGTYNADFDASALPSGVYYYKLESEGFSETKKMVLIK